MPKPECGYIHKREHVLMIDPSGNVKAVSCKHSPRGQVVRAKLAAGWKLHYALDVDSIDDEIIIEEDAGE